MSWLRAPFVRAFGRAGALALVVQTAACYSATPLDTSVRPPTGSSVVADITDQGRVDLGAQLGPSPLHVEGRVLAATDTTLTLGVTSVEGLRGDVSRWAGEPVSLRRTDIAVVQTRRLDKGRTALLGMIVVAGIAALLVTRSLVVGNSNGGEGNTKPGGAGNEQ